MKYGTLDKPLLTSKHVNKDEEIEVLFDIEGYEFYWLWSKNGKPISGIFHSPFNYGYCPLCVASYPNEPKACDLAEIYFDKYFLRMRQNVHFIEETSANVDYKKLFGI